MIYWQGKLYKLITMQYNGVVYGYLLDGILLSSPPKRAVTRGHIVTEDGVIIVLGRSVRPLVAFLLGVLIILCVLCWPRTESLYYQVTFSEKPLLREGLLYCNVINEADIEVTVQFLDSSNKSIIYTLSPGQTLPYIYVDFVPDTIRYNGSSDFQLEVRYD